MSLILKMNYRMLSSLTLTFCLVCMLGFSREQGDSEQDNLFEPGHPGLNIGQLLTPNITELSPKYLIYGVNPGEGFNLRRDVYIRVANLVNHLRIKLKENWILVLPPWRRLYHWRSSIQQNGVPWKTFFDIENMAKYVPVIEFDNFVQQTGSPSFNEIIYLQRHPDGFKNGWEEKVNEDNCTTEPVYWKGDDGNYYGNFWGEEHIFGRNFRCVSVQGSAVILTDFLTKLDARSVFVDRFEEVLHVEYGGAEFFRARRSLVFAKHLRKEADNFRAQMLNSTDESDKTPYNDENWWKQIPIDGSAIGGNYLAVHMRRADFLYSRAEDMPSIKAVRKQIKKLVKAHNLEAVFLATDGTDEEVKELTSKLKTPLHRFVPSDEIINKYGDGGVAIIDQWICAHGRYFIGSRESTFSFRIHEERDILGFNEDKTYNCLCPDKKIKDCEQPTRWRVKFD